MPPFIHVPLSYSIEIDSFSLHSTPLRKHDLVITERDALRLSLSRTRVPSLFTSWCCSLLTIQEYAKFHLTWRKEGTVEGKEYYNHIHYADCLFQ